MEKTAHSAPDVTAPGCAPRSEGQRHLLEVDASSASVAETLGVSRQAVSQWRRGLKVPGESHRRAMFDAFGIDPGSWGRRPGVEAPPAESRAPATVDPAPPADRAPGVRLATIDALRAHLADLERDALEEGLMPGELAKTRAAKTAALKVLADLEERELFREERLVESVGFQRLAKALLAALEPWPDAIRAVVDVLAPSSEDTSP